MRLLIIIPLLLTALATLSVASKLKVKITKPLKKSSKVQSPLPTVVIPDTSFDELSPLAKQFIQRMQDELDIARDPEGSKDMIKTPTDDGLSCFLLATNYRYCSILPESKYRSFPKDDFIAMEKYVLSVLKGDFMLGRLTTSESGKEMFEQVTLSKSRYPDMVDTFEFRLREGEIGKKHTKTATFVTRDIALQLSPGWRS